MTHTDRSSLRVRRALTSTVATAAVLGTGLLGFAGTAEATPRSSATVQSATSQVASSENSAQLTAGWSFYRAYWSKSACLSEGKAGKAKRWWSDYNCKYETGNDGKKKWFLYVYDRRV
ncbi:hypothetical protein OYE22_19110 [Streptomyces sp. 71268]|uniref:hypothetical protein n=1 Tax=Streptomyces sp. 71268 TaxID=3002640 RepID=UPI0023F94BAD|nr:hypothetical protein [Streptomyces sp. 71268]WEV27070.1 hypothetical protein OYE22_19110 [Streptomyces sp. 71268]